MSIRTLFKYLIGDRTAILTVANSPQAIWLGAIFVVSAGLAREYDAKDLTHEPWYLIVPLGASLATSFMLFCLIAVVGLRRGNEPVPFWSTYGQFLALYWMTAPLAWIYALPVERFLSATGATAANLALLAVVAFWRVALMTRVVTVYFGAGVLAALCVVMLFADTVALTVLYFTPLPIFNLMGGIPLTESESLIQGAALWVGILGVPTWILWLIGVGMIAVSRPDWQPRSDNVGSHRVEPTLWGFAAATILGWTLVLPFTQREQRLRHDVEFLLTHGRLLEAVGTMSRYTPDDFPPHWDPPPWLAYPNPHPPLIELLEIVLDQNASPWVRAIYVDKFQSELEGDWSFRRGGWQRRDSSDKDRLLLIFERLPLVEGHVAEFQAMWSQEEEPMRKKRLRALLRAAGHDTEEPTPRPTSNLSDGSNQ
jgi:hypothetical protein